MVTDRPFVLVVDDSNDVLELIEVLLEDEYTVRTATNADDAFALVRDWRPDVLLTDVSMPGRSGLELITQVRSDLRPPLPQIGVVSGFAGFEEAARSRGAELFLLKPIDQPTLRAGLRLLLDGPVDASRRLQGHALGRRAAALEEAERLVERFIEDNPDAVDRAIYSTESIAKYLGVSTALLLREHAGDLEVFASSDRDRFPPGASVADELGRVSSVIASGATLYIPRGGALADLCDLPEADELLVACAAVRTPKGEPVAAVALISSRDRPFDPRDLTIVEDVAHRVEDVLSGRRDAGGHRFGTTRFVSQTWWRRMLDRELELVPDGFAVSVTLVDTADSPTDQVEAGEAIFAQLDDHVLVSMRHEHQLAVFKRAVDTDTARDAMRRCLATIDETLGVDRATTLLLADIQPPRRSEVVLEILEALIGGAAPPKEGTVLTATLSARVERIS